MVKYYLLQELNLEQQVEQLQTCVHRAVWFVNTMHIHKFV